MPTESKRLSVLKTYKLYIGGKFPRTESGRYEVATNPKSGARLANYCHASRKDLRDAVVAARKAQASWGATSAYLRGQILYRAAEMLEGRASSLADEIASNSGATPKAAAAEVSQAIDTLVYYAGWTDKFAPLFGSVNPVASPHFNFTTPEPTGVVGVVCPDKPSLAGLVALVAPVILSGNAAVVLASETAPLPAITFAEIVATSDVPGGVINLLSGFRQELAPHFASHMDINAVVDGSGAAAITETLKAGAADNLKRVAIRADLTPDPYAILDTVEMKTAWHPIGV
jgi:acyl-CoA reductase-like NAD-dependent aldehyde dehydrogenase